MGTDLASAAGEALALLDRAGVEHMLVGALANDALGYPRSTFDVDLQVRLPAPVPAGASVVYGFVIDERTRDELFGEEVLVLHLPASGVPFELFVATHWFTLQALSRRVRVSSPALRRDVAIPTREDHVLLKLARMGDAKRPRWKVAQDALDIQRALDGGPVDRAYLALNAAKLGLRDALGAFLDV